MAAGSVLIVSGASDFDLQNGACGLKINYGGWNRATPKQQVDGTYPATVVDTISLQVSASSSGALGTSLQDLDSWLFKASEYINSPAATSPVYIKTQFGAEASPYYATIFNGAVEPRSSLYTVQGPRNRLLEYDLALERAAFWESDQFDKLIMAGASTLGGQYDYGAACGRNAAGTHPARIYQTFIDLEAGTDSSGLAEFWIGFKTSKRGTRGNFKSVWELESGSATTNVSSTGDATASNGNKMQWSPAASGGTNMNTRVQMNVFDADGTNFEDQAGLHTILLRAKITDTTTFRVRLASGYQLDTLRDNARVLISSTDWKLYDLGTVLIAPSRYPMERPTDGLFRNRLPSFMLAVKAQVAVENSGSLDLDCLALIPQEDGACHISSASVNNGEAGELHMIHGPDDRRQAYTVSSGGLDGLGIAKSATPEADNYFLPTGQGTMVLAAQDADQHRLLEECRVILRFYPRWVFYRGADGWS